MRSDIDIAQAAEKRPIAEVAATIGLDAQDLISYGPYIAKVPHTVAVKYSDRPTGKLVLVTAMTPTPQGEGKTTNTIGLGQALSRIGKKTMIADPGALARAVHGPEGRGGRRRVLTGAADGGYQSPFHG